MSIPVAIAIVLLIALGLAIATRPGTFRVSRSVTIAAPADIPFGYVNDFHRWTRWSPWEKVDPNLQRSYAGSESGVGAAYHWNGNSKAGQGSMVITESIPAQRIAIDLAFEKPFKARNVTEFTFAQAPGGVDVTWVMSGTNTTMGKAMSLVMNMDKMIGGSFDEGLGNLKAACEADAPRGDPPRG